MVVCNVDVSPFARGQFQVPIFVVFGGKNFPMKYWLFNDGIPYFMVYEIIPT